MITKVVHIYILTDGVVRCDRPTIHFNTGCELLKNYANDSGVIDKDGESRALQDWLDKKITQDELDFVSNCVQYYNGVIYSMCTGCYKT